MLKTFYDSIIAEAANVWFSLPQSNQVAITMGHINLRVWVDEAPTVPWCVVQELAARLLEMVSGGWVNTFSNDIRGE